MGKGINILVEFFSKSEVSERLRKGRDRLIEVLVETQMGERSRKGRNGAIKDAAVIPSRIEVVEVVKIPSAEGKVGKRGGKVIHRH